jgi:hypothetical protein
MAYIVKKDKVLFRAFSSYDDAVRYRDAKIKIMHDHCCVCENYPNINYYAEHDRHNYIWEIINISSKILDDINNLLFIVWKNKKIETIFST